MFRNNKYIQHDALKLELLHDVRRQAISILARETHSGKEFYYKLTKHETSENAWASVDFDPSLITLRDGDGLQALLQKVVDFAYDNYQMTPTRFKLDSDNQGKHLEDMRAIVGNQLKMVLPK